MNNGPTRLDRHFTLPQVRRVGPARPFLWLKRAVRDMRAAPIASLAYGLLFAIAGDVILIFSWRDPYLFTVAVSGFFLVAPLLAGGLYEISRRRAAGQPSTFFESLAGWRRNGQSMALYGLLLTLAAIVWQRSSALFFALFVPNLKPDVAAFVAEVLLNPDYRGLTLAWLLAGALLATLVFALSAVSIPMLVDRRVDFVTAMMASLRAVASNPGPLLVWAALIVTLTLAGFATLLCGLVVFMPLLGHASWHAYRDLVE